MIAFYEEAALFETSGMNIGEIIGDLILLLHEGSHSARGRIYSLNHPEAAPERLKKLLPGAACDFHAIEGTRVWVVGGYAVSVQNNRQPLIEVSPQ